MFKQQWDVAEYTDVYEDTFYFEYRQDAESFLAKHIKYAEKNYD